MYSNLENLQFNGVNNDCFKLGLELLCAKLQTKASHIFKLTVSLNRGIMRETVNLLGSFVSGVATLKPS